MSTFEHVIDYSPCASDDKIIRDGIVNFNSQTINEKATHFSIFAKDESQIIGGALIWDTAMLCILMYSGVRKLPKKRSRIKNPKHD